MLERFACASFALILAASCASSAASPTSSSAGSSSGTAGTGGASAGSGGPGGAGGGGIADAGGDVDKAAACATTFGTGLTSAFGRLDGTVLAVVPPGDNACALPNSTHVVIQVVTGGAAYRMVLDVLSNSGNPDVFFDEIDAPLVAGPWAEGWHPGVTLDYAGTLSVKSTAFTEMVEAALVAKVTSEIDLGAPISVFATSAGEPNSAHLIHRNLPNADGAIVVHPQSALPHYLLFRFAEQSF